MVISSKIPELVVSLEAFRQETLRDAVYFLRDKMKDTIKKQTDSSWAPLARITLILKAPETRKLYESGQMVGDIKAKIHRAEATVGIHPEAENHDKGVYNEYGTDHIPPRSFIRSTWAKYQVEVKARIEAIFIRKTKVGK